MSDRPRDPGADPDEPGLPQLRRFRFADGQVPGRRDAEPAAPSTEPPTADDATSPSDTSSLSDTFDVADLQYDDPEPGGHAVEDRPDPAWHDHSPPAPYGAPPAPPVWSGPGTGPLSTPPPGTGPVPARAIPKRSRGLLVGVAALVVIAVAVVAVLVFRPFSGDTTEEASRQTPPPATVAPSAEATSAEASVGEQQPSAGSDRDASGLPTVPGNFAAALCKAVGTFTGGAVPIKAEALEKAGNATNRSALEALRGDAADELDLLYDTVDGLATTTDGEAKIQDAVLTAADSASAEVDPETSSSPPTDTAGQATLIGDQLDRPITALKSSATMAGLADRYAALPGCDDVFT